MTLQSLTRGGKVKFLWVPAHVGVRGNERADEMAKALVKRKVEMQVSINRAEVKRLIWRKVNDMWQEIWNGNSSEHQGD